MCAHCNAEQGKSLPCPPIRWDYVVGLGRVASQGAWSEIRPAEWDEGPELLGVGDGPLPLQLGLPE